MERFISLSVWIGALTFTLKTMQLLSSTRNKKNKDKATALDIHGYRT
jgi:hypothetical protein